MSLQQLDPAFVHAALKDLYERSFYDFAKAAWEHVDNAQYKDNWHVEAICLHLQAIVEGKINRLLINIPPGAAKSMLANVLFPAWVWARDPRKQIINTSFSLEQSTRDTVKSRRLINSEWFQSFWPVKLQEDQNQKAKYENTKGGFREAKPYSNITGSRANIVIVDDPLSVELANSAAERLAAQRIFWNAVQSRLNDRMNDAIICIMQRVHEEDVAGTILEKNESRKGKHGYYEHLCIPMEYDGNDRTTSIGWKDPRTEVGEPFFPALFPKEDIAATKADMGPIAFAGQYNQTPAPVGDGFLRRDWFHTYGGMPCEAVIDGERCGKVHKCPASLQYYMSSDHANAGKSHSDYNVVRVWGMDADRNIWLVDSFREQCTIDVAMGVKGTGTTTQLADRGALPLIKKYRPRAWFAENDPTFRSIHPMLKGWMLEFGCLVPIYTIPTTGSKEQKAQAYQALASIGKVYLPETEMGEEALLEYMLFPRGKHDDQIDADGMLPRMINSAHPSVAISTPERREEPDYEFSSNDRLADSDSFFF